MKNHFNVKDYGVISGSNCLQTEKIQSVLDLAGRNGGTVVIPAGVYHTGGLLMHSNTELHLEEGTVLVGSDVPEDYRVFPVPTEIELHTDMEMIPEYFADRKNVRQEYRRALVSAYGAENITITGEGFGSVIDGVDCFDPDGEEHLRGPHGIFMSNCRNIILSGYTIQNSGNFHHQIDTCENIKINNLQVLGGHDGFHLHCCRDVEMYDCIVRSGDDCISGMNMENISIHNCDLNTSCQLFRIGGKHICVEDCHLWGPGVFPYRASVVFGRDDIKPLNEGHHDIISFMEYFSSSVHPEDASYDIVFRNCDIENPGKILYYEYGADTADGAHYCGGTPLTELAFDNCRISGDCRSSLVKGSDQAPLTLLLSELAADQTGLKTEELFDMQSEYFTVKLENL